MVDPPFVQHGQAVRPHPQRVQVEPIQARGGVRHGANAL